MSINSVNSINSTNAANSSSSSSKLSEETQEKLKKLGLDPSKYNTEAQAQAAIAQMQAQLQQNGANKSAEHNKEGKDSIKNEIQSLASKMGIAIGNSHNPKDILANISSKLEELKSAAGTDPTKLSQLNDYQTQYTLISNEIAKKEASHNMTGANALANYNKASIGFAA